MHNHSPGELLLCTHCHVDKFFFQLSLCLWQGSVVQFIVCPMIADSQLLAILFVFILFGFKMLVNYISVRLLSLTICLCKMKIGSQSIFKFSSGLVLLLVLITKTLLWIFMELLERHYATTPLRSGGESLHYTTTPLRSGGECLFWYSSACLFLYSG